MKRNTIPTVALSSLAMAALVLSGSASMAGSTLADKSWTATDDSKHWLLDADSDEERFRRLEEYLGGFSQAMREVGFRYRYTYFSIVDDNHELARHHWKKIGQAIVKGYLKRPARRENAREFLDDAWQVLYASLENGDADRIRADFLRARKACMECHRAEGAGFMNDQKLFRDTDKFPKLE